MSENRLRIALAQGEFVCTAELVLGRDHTVSEAEAFIEDVAAQPERIQAISLTDLPGGSPALPPEAFVSYVTRKGLTPIAHLTGKDGNRSCLEARLHLLASLGTENVLALTGDAQKEAFAGKAKPVHDLDSVSILRLIEAMREGLRYSVGSRSLRTTPWKFLPGAVVNPYKPRESDQMMQLYKLELKIRSGARFIVTQLGFNLRKLYELRQYMVEKGLAGIPTLANIYVPTPTIARMIGNGELAGCIIGDKLAERIAKEKKPERLERAALMVAAVRDLGFAGVHIGGFGLAHKDFMAILDRSQEIGRAWRARMDELVFETPGEFHLFPAGADGLSDGSRGLRLAPARVAAPLKMRVSEFVHRHVIDERSLAARFFAARLRDDGARNGSRGGLWRALLSPSSVYRKAALGCESCGDCIQDHLHYAGCSMHWCYKEQRNGPCGGSRPDGSCEARPDLPCLWNLVYRNTLASGEDPSKFAHSLIPPRDWNLDGTNALANRFANLDNLHSRAKL